MLSMPSAAPREVAPPPPRVAVPPLRSAELVRPASAATTRFGVVDADATRRTSKRLPPWGVKRNAFGRYPADGSTRSSFWFIASLPLKRRVAAMRAGGVDLEVQREWFRERLVQHKLLLIQRQLPAVRYAVTPFHCTTVYMLPTVMLARVDALVLRCREAVIMEAAPAYFGFRARYVEHLVQCTAERTLARYGEQCFRKWKVGA